jgi:8-oxo-dGTP pyrophosphatase MutT (NUDIX family)
MNDTSIRKIEADTLKTERSVLTKLRLAVTKPVMRLTRGMTLGSRVAVIDDQQRFLLVKPTYIKGWILPGGGVERGETALSAALRELEEEAAVVPVGNLEFRGIHSNHLNFPGDHLLFYVCRKFEQQPFKANFEIAAVEFFEANKLPEFVDRGSRRRIEELISGAQPSLEW